MLAAQTIMAHLELAIINNKTHLPKLTFNFDTNYID